jgi:HSP20 family protein
MRTVRVHNRPSLVGSKSRNRLSGGSTAWNSCPPVSFLLHVLPLRCNQPVGEPHAQPKRCRHVHVQQMLEAIGTRLSRLGQSGPPIARGSMNTTSSPTMPASRLLLEFERLLDVNFGLQTIKASANAALNEWSPVADIHETADALTFAVELPGIAPDQLQVTADENVLTIRGTRSDRHTGKVDARFHLIERHDGAFVRRFQLPPNVNASMITADFTNGLLELHVPKAALPQATVIQVNAASNHDQPAPRVVARGEVRAALKPVTVSNGSGKTARTGTSS